MVRKHAPLPWNDPLPSHFKTIHQSVGKVFSQTSKLVILPWAGKRGGQPHHRKGAWTLGGPRRAPKVKKRKEKKKKNWTAFTPVYD